MDFTNIYLDFSYSSQIALEHKHSILQKLIYFTDQNYIQGIFSDFVTFVKSLKYQQGRGHLDGIADQTALALRNLVRMVADPGSSNTLSHFELVLEDTSEGTRNVPPGWKTGTSTLQQLVQWAVNQLGQRTEQRLLDCCWLIVRRCAPVLDSHEERPAAAWLAKEYFPSGDLTTFCAIASTKG